MPNATMASEQPGLEAITDITDGCLKLGQFIGLDGPVAEDVFHAVLENPAYAANLFCARNEPGFRDYLVAHPQRRPNALSASDITNPACISSDGKGNIELMAKAAQALLNWSLSGFKTADNDLFQKRITACKACPEYIAPPKKLVYLISAFLSQKTAVGMICRQCGCIVDKKARVRYERCPEADPDNPGFSLWGEPVQQV